MFKSSIPYIAYFALSIVVILFAQYTHSAVSYVVDFYTYIDTHIEIFFSNTTAGLAARHVVSLVICPLIITGIPALIYRAIKHSQMPYFIEITWLVWLLMVLSNLLVK